MWSVALFFAKASVLVQWCPIHPAPQAGWMVQSWFAGWIWILTPQGWNLVLWFQSCGSYQSSCCKISILAGSPMGKVMWLHTLAPASRAPHGSGSLWQNEVRQFYLTTLPNFWTLGVPRTRFQDSVTPGLMISVNPGLMHIQFSS